MRIVFAATFGIGIYSLAQIFAVTHPDSAFVVGWVSGGLTAIVLSAFPQKR